VTAEERKEQAPSLAETTTQLEFLARSICGPEVPLDDVSLAVVLRTIAASGDERTCRRVLEQLAEALSSRADADSPIRLELRARRPGPRSGHTLERLLDIARHVESVSAGAISPHSNVRLRLRKGKIPQAVGIESAEAEFGVDRQTVFNSLRLRRSIHSD
jgi:hypothetical protein